MDLPPPPFTTLQTLIQQPQLFKFALIFVRSCIRLCEEPSWGSSGQAGVWDYLWCGSCCHARADWGCGKSAHALYRYLVAAACLTGFAWTSWCLSKMPLSLFIFMRTLHWWQCTPTFWLNAPWFDHTPADRRLQSFPEMLSKMESL